MNKKLFPILSLLIMLLASCSETKEENTEFDNWQERNDAYFTTVYTSARQEIDNGSTRWKIIRAYAKNPETTNPTDHIVVEVLAQGDEASRTTQATDSCSLHYRGTLMPTESYPNGYQFDSSWTGDYNLATMKPVKYVVKDFIDGFSTALLNMNPGDRWRIYIPQALGYGSSPSSSIPAYSTLIFDVTFVKSWPKRI